MLKANNQRRLMEALKELLGRKSDKAAIVGLVALVGIIGFHIASGLVAPPKSELEILAEESSASLEHLEDCLAGKKPAPLCKVEEDR